MELSGVNRLLAFAQELGVREAKSVPRPTGTTREPIEHLPSRSSREQDDTGFKVSLSATASRLAEELATPAASTAGQATESRASVQSNAETSNFRHDRAVAAYQKNAGAIPGERIRVIA